MGKRSNKQKNEEIDVKGTIKGFVSAEQEEKTQEQEIIDYQEKKKAERLRNLTSEEVRRIKEKEEEEEEKLKRIKQELLQSLKVRIPEIEKRFFIFEDNKNKKASDKENMKVKETGGIQKQKEEKKEEIKHEIEQDEREQ